MSIEGQGHFFTIYFPGFVCFVLYLDKISSERLQDHWSSGYRIEVQVVTNWYSRLGKHQTFVFFLRVDHLCIFESITFFVIFENY